MAYVLPGNNFTATFNVGDVGLSVPVSVVNAADGSIVTPASPTGVIETPAGSGIYSKTFAAPVTLGTYLAVADPGGGAPMLAVEFIVANEIPYIDDLPDGIVDRIRERVDTDLTDDELARMAAESYHEIEDVWGADGEARQEWLTGGTRTLTLLRRAASTGVTEVVEDGTTLTAGDYMIANGGRTLIRLDDQTPATPTVWGDSIRVTYAAHSDAAKRNEVVIKLVALGVEYRGGMRYDSVGDASSGYAVWLEERNQLIQSLAPWAAFTVA